MLLDLQNRATLHRFMKSVSGKYGIFSKLIEHSSPEKFYPHYYYTIQHADCKSIGCTGFSGGNATNPYVASAVMRTFGEALERYCLGFAPWQMPMRSKVSFIDLRSENALAPDDMLLFTTHQYQEEGFNCEPWTPNLKLDWVLGRDLSSGDSIWIPESLVSYGITSPIIFRGTTSGCAVGDSFESAALGAILELIERDSVMGIWWNKISPPQIDLHTIQDPISRAIIAAFHKAEVPLFVLDATNSIGVPVAVAVHRGNQSKLEPAFLMAGDSKLSMEHAIHKALTELLQNSARGNINAVRRKFSTNYNEAIQNFQDGIMFHCQEENSHLSSFILQGGPKRHRSYETPLHESAPQVKLRYLTNLLTKKGYRILVCDLTTQDVRAMSFVALRVIIPGLIPLNGQHRYRPWGVKRIYDFKMEMDQADGPVSESDLYPFPHPFP